MQCQSRRHPTARRILAGGRILDRCSLRALTCRSCWRRPGSWARVLGRPGQRPHGLRLDVLRVLRHPGRRPDRPCQAPPLPPPCCPLASGRTSRTAGMPGLRPHGEIVARLAPAGAGCWLALRTEISLLRTGRTPITRASTVPIACQWRAVKKTVHKTFAYHVPIECRKRCVPIVCREFGKQFSSNSLWNPLLPSLQ